jgi:mono/diheme cytochrome c family protein
LAKTLSGAKVMKRVLPIIIAIAALLFGVYLWSSRDVVPPAQKPIEVAAEFKKGQNLYTYWCATCHGAGAGAEGRTQLPGTAALDVKYKGNPPALLEERTDLTPEIITMFVRNGISVMPFFRKTEISDEDLQEISAYLTRPRLEPEK